MSERLRIFKLRDVKLKQLASLSVLVLGLGVFVVMAQRQQRLWGKAATSTTFPTKANLVLKLTKDKTTGRVAVADARTVKVFPSWINQGFGWGLDSVILRQADTQGKVAYSTRATFEEGINFEFIDNKTWKNKFLKYDKPQAVVAVLYNPLYSLDIEFTDESRQKVIQSIKTDSVVSNAVSQVQQLNLETSSVNTITRVWPTGNLDHGWLVTNVLKDKNQYTDLVFLMNDDYANSSQFYSDVSRIVTFLGKREPFSRNADILRYWALENYEDLGCTDTIIEGYMQCDNVKTVTVLLHTVLNLSDSVVILASKDLGWTYGLTTRYGGGGFVVISRLDDGFVTMHELGHQIGGLADEYVYTDPAKLIDYSLLWLFSPPLNCGTLLECAVWPKITGVKCFKGCTLPGAFRPTDNSCVMRGGLDAFDAVDLPIMDRAIKSFVGTSTGDPVTSGVPVGGQHGCSCGASCGTGGRCATVTGLGCDYGLSCAPNSGDPTGYVCYTDALCGGSPPTCPAHVDAQFWYGCPGEPYEGCGGLNGWVGGASVQTANPKLPFDLDINCFSNTGSPFTSARLELNGPAGPVSLPANADGSTWYARNVLVDMYGTYTAKCVKSDEVSCYNEDGFTLVAPTPTPVYVVPPPPLPPSATPTPKPAVKMTVKNPLNTAVPAYGLGIYAWRSGPAFTTLPRNCTANTSTCVAFPLDTTYTDNGGYMAYPAAGTGSLTVKVTPVPSGGTNRGTWTSGSNRYWAYSWPNWTSGERSLTFVVATPTPTPVPVGCGVLTNQESSFELGESWNVWRPAGTGTMTEERSNVRSVPSGGYSLKGNYHGTVDTPYFWWGIQTMFSIPTSSQEVSFTGKYYLESKANTNGSVRLCMQYWKGNAWLADQCANTAGMSLSTGSWRDFPTGTFPYKADATYLKPYIKVVGVNDVIFNVDNMCVKFLPLTPVYHATAGDGICSPDGRVEVNVLTTSAARLGLSVWDTIKVYNSTSGADLGFLKNFRVTGTACDNAGTRYRVGDAGYPGEFFRFAGSKASFRGKGLPQKVKVRAVDASGIPLSAMSGELDLGTILPTPTPTPKWIRCDNSSTTCAAFCTSKGKTATASCTAFGECTGTNRCLNQSEWNGTNNYCFKSTTDCNYPIPPYSPNYCSTSFNLYCCCR